MEPAYRLSLHVHIHPTTVAFTSCPSMGDTSPKISKYVTSDNYITIAHTLQLESGAQSRNNQFRHRGLAKTLSNRSCTANGLRIGP